METKNRKIGIIILLIFIMLSLYLISSTYMMAPDEYNYSHISWTNTKLANFKDIATSEISMYNKWTGRIPVHTIIQTMLYLGTWTYQILNPIVFAGFILLISCVIFKDKTYFKTIFTAFLICWGIKSFGEKFVWLSGSVNYLWTTSLMVSLITIYYNIFEKDKVITDKAIVPFFVLSFLSGWSQENVVFVSGSFIAIIGLSNLKKFIRFERKKKIIIISSIIMFGIGVLLLVLAPGNFARMNTSDTHFQITNIVENIKGIKYIVIVYVLTLLGLIFVKFKSKKEIIEVKIWKNQLLFLCSTGIALLPMMVIAEFPIRAMLPYEIMLIILIVSNSEYIIEKINIKKLVICTAVVLTVLTGYKFVRNVSIAQKYMKPYKEKIQMEINLAKINNESEIILSRFDDVNQLAAKNINMLIDYSPTAFASYPINSYMATYYDFDKIEAIGDNEFLVKIYLKNEIQNQTFNVVNSINGIKVRDSLKDFIDGNVNVISFIILKDEYETIKIDLPDNIKENVEKVVLNSVKEKQDILMENVVY